MKLSLIGCGTGNPEHITIQAIQTLRQADLILLPDKGSSKSALADYRYHILSAYLDERPAITPISFPTRRTDIPYKEAVQQWHDEISVLWQQALHQTPPPQHVALLVWGDPSLYDSTLRIADRLEPKPELNIIPGISSLHVHTAAHQIPLNSLAGDVQIMTGRNLAAKGFPEQADTIFVMLDGQTAFCSIENADRYQMYWGAYLGMKEQILIAGRLDEVREEICQTRAAARQQQGWIMDSYLIRRLGCS